MQPPASPHEHLRTVNRTPDRLGGRSRYVCLDKNERVGAFSPAVFNQMVATLNAETFCSYPDPTSLYTTLGRHLGLPETHLILTGGSDGGIKALFEAYVCPGDRIVMPDPTYAMYFVYSRIYAATPVQIPYDENLNLDLDAFMRELSFSPRIAAIPNPAQPTGTVLSRDELRRIVAAAADVGTLVIVDEAYYPFYSGTALDWLEEFPNLVVTRTFSKAGGLAGLRLGYIAAAPQVVETLYKVRAAYDVNSVALRIGQYLVERPQLMQDYVEEVRQGSEALLKGLKQLGLEAPRSYTNFQLIRLSSSIPAGKLVAALKSRGYLVRWPLGPTVLDQYFRVTLGPAAVMEGFLGALRSALEDVDRG